MTERSNYQGQHDEPGGITALLTRSNLARTESMDIVNDPRFFQDNVINYRLAAFGCLAVVSGLMVQNCMDQLFGMNKNMQFRKDDGSLRLDGILQFVAFVLLVCILFVQMLATYVSVAQPYHTYRLMTAGQTGFEAACAYYLNVNISVWRHFVIHYSFYSLPMYIAQMGIRLVVKFERGTRAEEDLPDETPQIARIQGLIFNGILAIFALILFMVHLQHFRVFHEKYQAIGAEGRATGPGLVGYMQSLMAPRAARAATPFTSATARRKHGAIDV